MRKLIVSLSIAALIGCGSAYAAVPAYFKCGEGIKSQDFCYFSLYSADGKKMGDDIVVPGGSFRSYTDKAIPAKIVFYIKTTRSDHVDCQNSNFLADKTAKDVLGYIDPTNSFLTCIIRKN